jgi:hypothetical protein
MHLALIAECLLMAGCLHECDEKTPTAPSAASDGPAIFSTAYNHRSATLSLTIDIGGWMHRGQRLERATIAKWLGVPFEQKELFEPINVLWVDPAASSEVAARDSVIAFLDQCDFAREGNIFGALPRHSTGYSAWANGQWRAQYDPDDAWVQLSFGGLSGDHGRIFPAFQVMSAAGAVYFTPGAFSREGSYGNPILFGLDCALNRENCHAYQSFDAARDKLNCGASGWIASGPVDLRNRYPASMGLSYSTADHTGALVFERSR